VAGLFALGQASANLGRLVYTPDLMAFNDDMQDKYKFGTYTGLDDPQTGKPALRNMF